MLQASCGQGLTEPYADYIPAAESTGFNGEDEPTGHVLADVFPTMYVPLFVFNEPRVAMQNDMLLSVDEFATKARMKAKTVYRNLHRIPHVRIGSTVRIPASALEPTMPPERAEEPAAN